MADVGPGTCVSVVAFPPLTLAGFVDHGVRGAGAACPPLALEPGEGCGSGCCAAGAGRAPDGIQLCSDPCADCAGLFKSSFLVVGGEAASWRVPLPEHVIRERGAAC